MAIHTVDRSHCTQQRCYSLLNVLNVELRCPISSCHDADSCVLKWSSESAAWLSGVSYAVQHECIANDDGCKLRSLAPERFRRVQVQRSHMTSYDLVTTSLRSSAAAFPEICAHDTLAWMLICVSELSTIRAPRLWSRDPRFLPHRSTPSGYNVISRCSSRTQIQVAICTLC